MLNKESKIEFLDGLEKLLIKFSKTNRNSDQRRVYAEATEMFLSVIFGFFDEHNAVTQFAPSIMASVSNVIQDAGLFQEDAD